MLKRLLAICLIIASLAKAYEPFHDACYQLGYDLDFSPYAGGNSLLFVHRGMERMEGAFLENSSLYGSETAAARFWRFIELYFGWMAVNQYAITFQHELFGHGYRIRNLGSSKAVVDGYTFNAPFPYGDGGAKTQYSITENFNLADEVAVAMAGVESTAILAFETKMKWLASNHIDPRQSVLYLLAQNDLPAYIGSLGVSGEADLSGHDIHAYVNAINLIYTSKKLTVGRLNTLSWINALDPFSYYAIYSWGTYISSAKEPLIPMIPIFSARYLPSFRLGLTPFGPEVFSEHFLLAPRPIYFYLKAGNHAPNFYLGAGMYSPFLWEYKHLRLGLRLDCWRQPKLLDFQKSIPLEEIDFSDPPPSPIYSLSDQCAKRIGAAGSLLLSFGQKHGGLLELGLKSKGFLPGYSLRTSPVVRLFYMLDF